MGNGSSAVALGGVGVPAEGGWDVGDERQRGPVASVPSLRLAATVAPATFGEGRALGPAQGSGGGAGRVVLPLMERLASERRAARQQLPEPTPLVRQVALGLLEMEAGCRRPMQLERRCEPEVWDRVCAQVRVDPSRPPVLPKEALVRVHCQEPVPGVANGVAVVRRDGRVTSISVTLEARQDRWVVTDLRMLVPRGGYLPPWPPTSWRSSW